MNPIYVAIDTHDLAQALTLCHSLAPHVGGFKLGLEFFTSCGPEGVQSIAALGKPIFLDLKLHDIPNTVAHAIKAVRRMGVHMCTVHLAGGPEMLKAALRAATSDEMQEAPLLLLGVSVLTSMDGAQLEAIGIVKQPTAQVALLAEMAQKAGMQGLVCSAEELAAVRERCGNDITLVVPGIRPLGAEHGDQKRVATPTEAMQRGATFLVIGRPITQSADPALAAQQIAATLFF
jgi:orotidine-5'-phosphate decarboxylase